MRKTLIITYEDQECNDSSALDIAVKVIRLNKDLHSHSPEGGFLTGETTHLITTPKIHVNVITKPRKDGVDIDIADKNRK